eukprot:5579643-Pyramimonas_sp.AAC.1
MTERLIEHRAPVFCAKPVDADLAQSSMEQHVPALDFPKVAPPSPALLRRVALKMRCSEPGLGSIPCSAWAATSTGIQVLADAMMWTMQGQSLFKSSNNALQVWLPRGEEVDDSLASGCASAPSAQRCSSARFRNTDITLIASTIGI